MKSTDDAFGAAIIGHPIGYNRNFHFFETGYAIILSEIHKIRWKLFVHFLKTPNQLKIYSTKLKKLNSVPSL